MGPWLRLPPRTPVALCTGYKAYLSNQSQFVWAAPKGSCYIIASDGFIRCGRAFWIQVMDLKRIKELIDLFANSDLAELNIREGDSQLHLARRSRATDAAKTSTGSSESEIPPQPPVGDAAPTVFHPASASTAPSDDLKAKGDGREVLAPMHGVLHLSPNPDAPPFVTVGEKVQAGQTLGVLEAMKMFHSLKGDVDGVIAAVLAPSGSEVAAGQPLFRIT